MVSQKYSTENQLAGQVMLNRFSSVIVSTVMNKFLLSIQLGTKNHPLSFFGRLIVKWALNGKGTKFDNNFYIKPLLIGFYTGTSDH